MIRKYIQAGMEHAKYEILPDDGTYYGEIRECRGVYSNAPTLEKCRNELEEVLEEWILFRVYKNLEIPPIDDIEIKIKKQAVAWCQLLVPSKGMFWKGVKSAFDSCVELIRDTVESPHHSGVIIL